MAKIYTVEVVQESRALVTIEAENREDLNKQITEKVNGGQIEWNMKDHIITDVIDVKDKK